jgi:3'(2'), 5'-bisphosphate nucleotidase
VTPRERKDLLGRFVEIAARASQVVREGYEGELEVAYKTPQDPVTQLDRRVNELLVGALERDFPGVPIVAEESEPSTWAERATAEVAFYVDPIDGTKELLARNGEFAVMLGVAEHGEATVGVVDCPATGRVFTGAVGAGAWELKGGTRRAMRPSSEARPKEARYVVSRSHRDARTDALLSRIGATRVRPVGGAGIKAALVAVGEADAYVQLARAGQLWDGCGPEAIVRAAGAKYTEASGAAVDYRRETLALTGGVLCANPALYDALRGLLDQTP